jgi:enediyne polyketide synthase
MTRISLVGMACRYPDASSPRDLWENAVAGRRAFRRLPDVRMRAEDYWDPDPAAPDRFYARNAAVIEGYEFDRVAFKVAGSTYRSTDLTHWLALDMASRALADAGFPGAEGLPRERTTVVVGNTLTGEFSRANQMRLRWPYVRRVLAAALRAESWDDERVAGFLAGVEEDYKRPFPAIDEDTLAGGLANTIAGRICNHFDLRGGGYTVDGACSSSLLSVATACNALTHGDADVAVAGGVDLSIDPFEVIGFAKTGALARGEMRVYDRRSNGFWPGEGCGMVVLMRESDALAAGHRIYATVVGWGMSSDGRGGITRPEAEGYQLALRRAYERAGFGIDTVGLFEGHGTGTAVGDATELQALSAARGNAGPPAVISSIKGMIGHTKAAAGVAGLIKAAMSVYEEVLPPALGTVEPHEVLAGESPALRVLRRAEPWPAARPVRAGVTAMGFGGINTHLVLENSRPRRRGRLDPRVETLAAAIQDAELLVVDAATAAELRERLAELAGFVPSLSYAQLADLAAHLHGRLRDRPYRAAAVVSSPDDAERRLTALCDALDAGESAVCSADGRTLLGHARGPGRIGFLFPGQGSGRGAGGGALRRRLPEVEDLYAAVGLPSTGDMVATEVAQPRIATGSAAGLLALSRLGIRATVAVGHSLGELSALHWAGVLDAAALVRVAGLRGAAMAGHSASGTMANIAAAPETVRALIGAGPAVIAGYNSPEHTVVSGSVEAVDEVCRRAGEAGLSATRLKVSHAFHSPLVAPAADVFGAALAAEPLAPLAGRVVSTVTGEPLAADADLRALLHRQITDPVQFTRAVTVAAKDVDLFVEVGPGRVLTTLTAASVDVPVVALDTDDESVAGLLKVVGAAYVAGAAPVDATLFQDRLVRPIDIGAPMSFLTSPCEQAPSVTLPATAARPAVSEGTPGAVAEAADGESTVDLLRRHAAERAELPLELVREDSRLLDDLHLSSITVGQLIGQVGRTLGLPAAQIPANLAVASVREVADMLDELAATAGDAPPVPDAAAAGVRSWTRAWRVDLDELPLPARTAPHERGDWQEYAEPGHPLAGRLREALQRADLGTGVLVLLPADRSRAALPLALTAAQEAARLPAGGRYVLVQHGPGAAGLAKSLHLEAPGLRVTVVHVPPGVEAADRIVAEVAATDRFSEVFLEESGVRRVPTMRAMPVTPARTAPALGAADVLLVTGGGKGITAECAVALAVDSGAALAVLGRADPADDDELAANLRRMAETGVRAHYVRADVTDAEQVRFAVAEIRDTLGDVTAVLHGAGRNEPAAVPSLTADDFERTFAPKVDGLDTVLDAVGADRLRLLVTLGSIIGRAGLRGEAHYATANDWLATRTAEVARRHPHCRALCLEWSVWSGVGMGERLSVVESLVRDGITPITTDQGVEVLRRLVADPDAPGTVVISGRTEGIDTVRHDLPPLPLLRFVDRTLVRYHGVELVAEAVLSAGTDRYLADHALDDNLLFPAVFGMEAMAQVACATTGRTDVPVLTGVEFLRPVVVPPGGATTVRIAAVVVDDDTVDVAVRSAETEYAADHFRARLRYAAPPAAGDAPELSGSGAGAVDLDPATELYGDIMFQGERFRRVRRYHRIAARDADADLAVADTDWFAPFLPQELLLGDPGVRDALMHGNQVCVPDATLLPAGIDAVRPAGGRLAGTGEVRYCATERSQDGDTYVYDVALRTPDGEVVERWEGLRLRAVRKSDGRGPWSPAILGSYLQRTSASVLPAEVAVTVQPDPPDDGAGDARDRRRAATALALTRLLDRPVTVRYRPDGRPEVAGDAVVSAAHGAGLTMVVTAGGPAGCDVQPVTARSDADWQPILGANADLARRVAQESGEDAHTAATRVWCAVECLQKSGRTTTEPVVVLPARRDGWTVFDSGGMRIATFATYVRGVTEPVVFAIAIEGRD